ncbi:MAG: hypothetical protein ISN29_10160 [Gammaproteobacteria bacterium AqS3]|nr:hypothetical protein [Gammaproteobacteria bacterium AqS3]
MRFKLKWIFLLLLIAGLAAAWYFYFDERGEQAPPPAAEPFQTAPPVQQNQPIQPIFDDSAVRTLRLTIGDVRDELRRSENGLRDELREASQRIYVLERKLGEIQALQSDSTGAAELLRGVGQARLALRSGDDAALLEFERQLAQSDLPASHSQALDGYLSQLHRWQAGRDAQLRRIDELRGQIRRLSQLPSMDPPERAEPGDWRAALAETFSGWFRLRRLDSADAGQADAMALELYRARAMLLTDALEIALRQGAVQPFSRLRDALLESVGRFPQQPVRETLRQLLGELRARPIPVFGGIAPDALPSPATPATPATPVTSTASAVQEEDLKTRSAADNNEPPAETRQTEVAQPTQTAAEATP